jgi:hypothetical protein
MVYQRGHKPASLNPPSQQNASPFAPRPFADPKKAPATAKACSHQPDKLDAEEELLQRRFDTGVGEPEQEPHPIQRTEPKPRIYSTFQEALGEPVQREVKATKTKNEVVCDDINDIKATHAGNSFKYNGVKYDIDATFKPDDHRGEQNIPFVINRLRKTAAYAGASKAPEEIHAELQAHAASKEADKNAKLALVLRGIMLGAKPKVEKAAYRHNKNSKNPGIAVGKKDDKETEKFIVDTLMAKDAPIEIQGDRAGRRGGIVCRIRLNTTEDLVFEYIPGRGRATGVLSVFHLGPGG